MNVPLYKKIEEELADLENRSTLRSLPKQGNYEMDKIDFILFSN